MGNSKAKEKSLAAYLSVASNTGLTIFKFIVGLLSGSISIVAEALHSLNDFIASVIATYAVKESSKPPDEDHKFGHGKAEDISALLEAAMIIFAAIFIIYESIARLLNPHGIELIELGILVMLVSTLVNLVAAVYMYRVAKRTKSSALRADAAHHATDVITSVGVFAGLLAIRLTGYMLLDPIVAILVSFVIIWTGASIILTSSRDLMDTRLSPDEEKSITEILELHKGQFLEFHEMRTRRSGSEKHIDMHLVVPKSMSVKDGHSLVDHIETEIKEKIAETHVIIHLEPCDVDCDNCDRKEICPEEGHLR
jgi:cation diffusion facilitator family transporter